MRELDLPSHYEKPREVRRNLKPFGLGYFDPSANLVMAKSHIEEARKFHFFKEDQRLAAGGGWGYSALSVDMEALLGRVLDTPFNVYHYLAAGGRLARFAAGRVMETTKK